MIFLGGQFLLILAYHNGYPLNMGDSGGYVLRGFTREINHHWAQFYSYFVRMTSFDLSLWGVVFVQNYVMAYLIFRTWEQCIRRSNFLYYGYLILMFCLTFSTSLPFISNLLMPDIFTPAGLLAMLIIFLKSRLDVEYVLLTLIIGISVISHKSSGPIFALGFYSFLLLMTLLFYFQKRERLTKLYWVKLITISGILLLAPLAGEQINTAFFVNDNPTARNVDGAGTSDSKYHFVFVKLEENKMLDEFLSEHCPEKQYPLLCDSVYLAKFRRNGIGDDLHGNDQELFIEVEDIGRTALWEMKYMKVIIKRGLWRVYRMYTRRGGIPLLNSIFNEYQIPRFYDYLPNDIARIYNCRIYAHVLISDEKLRLIRQTYDKIVLITTLAMIGFIVWLFIAPKRRYNNLHVTLIAMFIFILVHYVLMATFAGIYNMRYSARITWLFVFGTYLGVAYLVDQRLLTKGMKNEMIAEQSTKMALPPSL
jgi:hypothetical protein